MYGGFGVGDGDRAILCRLRVALIMFACWTVASERASAGREAESCDKPISTRHLASRQPHYCLDRRTPPYIPHHCHRSRAIFVSTASASVIYEFILAF